MFLCFRFKFSLLSFQLGWVKNGITKYSVSLVSDFILFQLYHVETLCCLCVLCLCRTFVHTSAVAHIPNLLLRKWHVYWQLWSSRLDRGNAWCLWWFTRGWQWPVVGSIAVLIISIVCSLQCACFTFWYIVYKLQNHVWVKLKTKTLNFYCCYLF